MELIIRLWKNFKVQPEIWFFYGFLSTFTLTIRKVVWFFPLRGEFNEYSGIYLYLSDILLILTLLTWVYTILYNKIDLLSMLKNVPRGTLVVPLVLVVWSFISLIWAENKIISIFRSVKILEFYLLYAFVWVRFFRWDINRIVPRETLLRKTVGLIMIIGFFQAIIGITQFLLQHSIGLFWLKESLISPDIAGVAKVIFDGEAFVRAYGLFPHPNILGGFLMFSILIALFYKRMFHPSSKGIVPRGTIPFYGIGVEHPMGQTWNNFLLRFGCETIIFKLILGIQLLALILTFSKSAILGLFLGLIYYVYTNVPSQKECSIPEGMFHVEHSTGQVWNILRDRCGKIIDFFTRKRKLIITLGLIFVFSFIIAKPDFYSLFFKGLDERAVYVNVSRETIWDNPILGVGNGQFVIGMENLPIIKENWMLEPVHNVLLLVWSELGLVGFLILAWFVYYILRVFHPATIVPPQKQENCSIPEGMFHPRRNVPRGTFYGTGVEHPTGQAWNMSELVKTFGAIFMGLVFVMFFDHYLWDIQQGSFLLWMTLGFLVGAGEWVRCYLTK